MSYTSEDFRNAEFARHPDGRIAARVDTNYISPWVAQDGKSFWLYSDAEMADDGWFTVPAEAKPTITKKEFNQAVERGAGMSEEELRERIATAMMPALISNAGYFSGDPDRPEVFEMEGFITPREVAQAVIDDLGLRFEYMPPILAHEKPRRRVIGNWEEA